MTGKGLKAWTEFGNNAYTNLREGKAHFQRYKWTHERICNWTRRKILEIGIGSGHAIKELANLGHDCYAMDLRNNIFKVTDSKHYSPDIEYIVQNVDQPDINWSNNYGKFHVVIIHYVLQHLLFDSNALYAIWNMLDINGTLFVSVPIAGDNLHSAHAYNKNTFIRLLEGIGFKVEETHIHNNLEFIVEATKVS